MGRAINIGASGTDVVLPCCRSQAMSGLALAAVVILYQVAELSEVNSCESMPYPYSLNQQRKQERPAPFGPGTSLFRPRDGNLKHPITREA
jgi:hypothetical protein